MIFNQGTLDVYAAVELGVTVAIVEIVLGVVAGNVLGIAPPEAEGQ